MYALNTVTTDDLGAIARAPVLPPGGGLPEMEARKLDVHGDSFPSCRSDTGQQQHSY